MRGASSSVVGSAIIACLLALAPARGNEIDTVRALAREKAAAVSLLRAKAANQMTTLAQDRIFIAYLNASTQGQGARLRARIVSMFKTVWSRFGVREIALIGRDGAVVVRVGNTRHAPPSFDVKTDPALAAGFAQAPLGAAVVASDDALTYAAPVVSQTQTEYVLSGRQDLTTYRAALARGAPRDGFAVLLDAKGRVLADTRESAPSALIAGLSFDAMRRAVKGKSDEGAGEIARGAERFYVGYRKAGDWTVVTGAPALPPRRCPNVGARLCG